MPRSLIFLPVLAALATFSAQAAQPDHDHHHGHAPAKSLEYRQGLALDAEEAAHIRLEMRGFLSSVQKIVTGAAHNDMKMVAEAATASGMAAAHEVPPALRAKLPLEFKRLGQATHVGFDDLARDASSMADPSLALQQLSRVMSNCVSCHATFRIEQASGER